MQWNPIMRTALAALAITALGAEAQQAQIPVRPLGPVVAVATAMIGPSPTVRELSDGRILVNDQSKRRLLLIDSTMTHYTVVADSVRGTSVSYGNVAGALVPYLGDSSLFLDASSVTLLVIDPNGKMGRASALPKTSDAPGLTFPSINGYPGTDSKGRLVYEGHLPLAPPAVAPPGAPPAPRIQPDSSPIIRGDLATHELDTVAYVRLQWRAASVTSVAPDGKRSLTSTESPIPLHAADLWTVTSDGAIAIVRGQDYHVDWYGLDGHKTSSARVAHTWTRVTDDDKARLVDSVRKQHVQMNAMTAAMVAFGPANGTSIIRDVVAPGELPDYYPPFPSQLAGGGSALADLDGNIWLIAQGSPVKGVTYEVIDRHGELIDRVVMPVGYTIVGFGRGVAYIMPGITGAVLAKALIR